MWEPTSNQYYEWVLLEVVTRAVTIVHSSGSHREDKDKWIDKERQRWASLLNVPMKQQKPSNFPPRTLPIMRTLAALRELDGGQHDRLVCRGWFARGQTGQSESFWGVDHPGQVTHFLGSENPGTPRWKVLLLLI